MTVWRDASLIGVYTASPTHCGVGQAAGAVDLPIAREKETGFPIIPAASLKGSIRDYMEREGLPQNSIELLFGRSLEAAEEAESAKAGALAFTESRLLAMPVRCLSTPFMHATCPLILERFRRDLRAIGVEGFLKPGWRTSDLKAGQAHVADEALDGKPLVLEDLVYEGEQVGHLPMVADLARALADMLPEEEEDTKERLRSGLVVVPDEDFADMVGRAVPVRARIRLTKGKTADQWINPETGELEKGNLWYEEFLTSDCLFASFVGERRQFKQNNRESESNREDAKGAMEEFLENADKIEVIQVGGNETVGCGLCFVRPWSGNGAKP